MQWDDILARWDLLDYCFTTHLNTELGDIIRVRSWAWFTLKVSGLLSDPDTLIARYFNHREKEG